MKKLLLTIILLMGTLTSSAHSYTWYPDHGTVILFPKTTINKNFKGFIAKEIAVLPIDENDIYFSDNIETLMMELGHDVKTRTNIEKILEEHKLSLSGILEKENSELIGKLTNIYGIVLCHIEEEKEVCYVKYIDLKTGTIVYTSINSGGTYITRTTEQIEKYGKLQINIQYQELIGSAIKTLLGIFRESIENEFAFRYWQNMIDNNIVDVNYCNKYYKDEIATKYSFYDLFIDSDEYLRVESIYRSNYISENIGIVKKTGNIDFSVLPKQKLPEIFTKEELEQTEVPQKTPEPTPGLFKEDNLITPVIKDTTTIITIPADIPIKQSKPKKKIIQD